MEISRRNLLSGLSIASIFPFRVFGGFGKEKSYSRTGLNCIDEFLSKENIARVLVVGNNTLDLSTFQENLKKNSPRDSYYTRFLTNPTMEELAELSSKNTGKTEYILCKKPVFDININFLIQGDLTIFINRSNQMIVNEDKTFECRVSSVKIKDDLFEEENV